MRARINSRLADESGVTLIVAIMVLTIVSLTVAAVFAAGLSLNSTTRRDADAKRALAAAEAGLEMGRYRLNRIKPAGQYCLTDQAVLPDQNNRCPGFHYDLGNGVSFDYYITFTTPTNWSSAGYMCGGTALVAKASQPQRCLTGVGRSGNVTRRVQMAVNASAGSSLFPFGGLIGLDAVDITENSFGDIHGWVGSNGTFTLKSCATGAQLTGWDPAPGATYSETCNNMLNVANPARTTAYTLGDFNNLIVGTVNNNDNVTVFGSNPNYTYNASTRTLTDASDNTLILDGANPRANSGGVWQFNFCKIVFTHKTSIWLKNGARAQFFIDDASRGGSGCTGVVSDMNISNVSYINYDMSTNPPTPGDPSALQFYYQGSNRLDISNQSGFSAALYAPNAEVKFTNKTVWIGGVAAKVITATNGLDFWAGDVSNVGASGGVTRYIKQVPGWIECSSAVAYPGDPTQGC